MLANLLPGFREVRAPFAAGALLLASLYVAFHDRIERATEPDELGGGLHALLDVLGPRGRLAVAAVVAYLVGTVFVAIVRGATRQLYVSMLPAITRLEYIDSDDRKTVWQGLAAPFSRPSLRRLAAFVEWAGHSDLAPEVICREIVLGGGKRLLLKSKDLYAEFDRMESEAEFRDGVIGPALVFVGVCLATAGWSAPTKLVVGAVAVGLAVTLWVHARRLDREALSMHAHAVADGVVATAAIDESYARRGAA